MSFTIGADVEIFARKKFGSKYKHMALCGLIGGTKEQPKQMTDLPPGFMVQEDNVSLEFNIPPASGQNAFINYIEAALKASKKIIYANKLSPSKDSSAIFDEDQLVHPNALVFGCEPDYDAWKMIENRKPKAKNSNLRTAGGHIHVGTSSNIVDVIHHMDLRLGIPSIILDNSEASRARRELYGKAGACRPKPYGVEYRVLSNFWIFKKDLIRWVYQETKNASMTPFEIKPSHAKEIQRVINTGDVDAARTIANDFGLSFPSV